MIITNLIYHNLRKSNTFTPPVFMDSPRECLFGKEWWHNYNIKDFDYKFNDWAFRGEEYIKYVNKPVNICLGDSFTVNIGGPLSHSWPSQLSKYFDIPTLNLGIDGAGNDTIKMVYEKACEIFNVQKTFVMYSYFHRRLDDNELTRISTSDNENYNYFKKNFIDDAVYTFVPRWCWSKLENEYISNNYKNNLINFENFIQNLTIDSYLKKYIDKKQYNKLKGSLWPDYEKFVNNNDHSSIISELCQMSDNFLRIFFSNRDGYHLNQEGNRIVAEYFYKNS